jgi:hypothetical protein
MGAVQVRELRVEAEGLRAALAKAREHAALAQGEAAERARAEASAAEAAAEGRRRALSEGNTAAALSHEARALACAAPQLAARVGACLLPPHLLGGCCFLSPGVSKKRLQEIRHFMD